MKLRILILAAIALLPLVSCGNRAVSAQLDDIESYIQERPDSALAILKAIDKQNLATRSLKAKYAVLYSAALDKNYIDTTDLSIIEPAVNYYRRHGSADEKLKALYYQGRVHFNAGDYNKAIVSFSEALPLVEKTTDNKYDGMLYSTIAAAYNLNFAIDECIAFSKKAYESFIAAGEKDLADWALYSQAQDYSNMREYSKADSLYKSLLSCDDLSVSLRGTIESSYAFMITNRGIRQELTVADSLFRSAIAHSGSLNNDANWGAYAYALSKNGRFEEADIILQSLLAANSPRYDYWAGRVAEEKGDYKNASANLFSTLTKLDSTVNNALRQSTIKSQRDFFESQSQKAESKVREQRLVLVIIGIMAVIFTSLIYLFFKRRSRIAEAQKTELLEMKDRAIEQLSETNRAFETERIQLRKEYARLFKTQFKYFAEIGEAVTLANSYVDKTNSYKSVYDKASRMVDFITSDKTGQNRFEKTINESMFNVMEKFHQDFPDLGDNDYRFVSYVFAGFDAYLISVLLKYNSIPTVYEKKYRLKKMIAEKASPNKQDYLALFA